MRRRRRLNPRSRTPDAAAARRLDVPLVTHDSTQARTGTLSGQLLRPARLPIRHGVVWYELTLVLNLLLPNLSFELVGRLSSSSVFTSRVRSSEVEFGLLESSSVFTSRVRSSKSSSSTATTRPHTHSVPTHVHRRRADTGTILKHNRLWRRGPQLRVLCGTRGVRAQMGRPLRPGGRVPLRPHHRALVHHGPLGKVRPRMWQAVTRGARRALWQRLRLLSPAAC